MKKERGTNRDWGGKHWKLGFKDRRTRETHLSSLGWWRAKKVQMQWNKTSNVFRLLLNHICTQSLGSIICFQSSILTTPHSTKFYKVVVGLKIARTSSPGITHHSCRCGSSCGRTARGFCLLNGVGVSSNPLSAAAVLRSPPSTLRSEIV